MNSWSPARFSSFEAASDGQGSEGGVESDLTPQNQGRDGALYSCCSPSTGMARRPVWPVVEMKQLGLGLDDETGLKKLPPGDVEMGILW